MSNSGLYFQPYLQGAFPLLGESYEYLCHVCQPNLDNTSLNLNNDAHCTLNTFASLFASMKTNHNNVVRLNTIFNFSPGKYKAPCLQALYRRAAICFQRQHVEPEQA
jgi:hypothetical protein